MGETVGEKKMGREKGKRNGENPSTYKTVLWNIATINLKNKGVCN